MVHITLRTFYMRKPNIILYDGDVFNMVGMVQAIDPNEVSLTVFNQVAPFVDHIKGIPLGSVMADVLVIGNIKTKDIGKLGLFLGQLQPLRQEGKLIIVNVGNTKSKMNPDLFDINFFKEKGREFIPQNDMPEILAEALGLLNDEVRRELEIPGQTHEGHLQQI